MGGPQIFKFLHALSHGSLSDLRNDVMGCAESKVLRRVRETVWIRGLDPGSGRVREGDVRSHTIIEIRKSFRFGCGMRYEYWAVRSERVRGGT